MENKEEILKKLLNNLLENRLKRLEKRNIEQTKDLKFEKESYNKQGLLLKKLCAVKIEPKKNLKKSANDKLSKGRDKTPNQFRTRRKNSLNNNDKKMLRSKTPNMTLRKKKVEPKEKQKKDNLKKSKTPSKVIKKSVNSKTPSYMQSTSSNVNKNIKTNSKPNLMTKKPKTPDNKTKKNLNKKKQETKQIKNNDKENNLKLIDIKVEDMKEYISPTEENKQKVEETKIEQKEEKVENIEKAENKINFELLIDNKIINTLSSFLDEQSQYNLFSCNKKLIKYIYEKLLNSLDILRKENDISSSNTIKDQINSVKLKYTNEELNAKPPVFALSKGTIKAIELLNGKTYNQIFTTKELLPPQNEILIVYRIFFQLLKVNNIYNIKDEKLFWLEATDYILNNSNGKTGEFFKESINNFDFSIKNIYEVKKILGDNKDKIKPSFYSKICGTTGLVIFLIKDTLEYIGVMNNSKKNTPCLVLKLLEYIEAIQNRIENYINYTKKFNDNI